MIKRHLTVSLLLVSACGGSSAFEGIYEASSWTQNSTGCDAEGPSVLEQQFQTTFYIKEEHLFGSEFLNVVFCDDLANCEEMASDEDTLHLGGYIFEEGSDSGWTNRWYSGFAWDGGMCEGDMVVSTLSPAGEGGVRIEEMHTPVPPFPPDGEGDCDDEVGLQLAEGQPCSSLEVITAANIAELP